MHCKTKTKHPNQSIIQPNAKYTKQSINQPNAKDPKQNTKLTKVLNQLGQKKICLHEKKIIIILIIILLICLGRSKLQVKPPSQTLDYTGCTWKLDCYLNILCLTKT